jgi:hypothetical protein
LLALTAIDMGYGHLRAAQPLGDLFSVPLLELDRPPIATERDVRSWRRARWFHEMLSRASQWPLVGPPFRAVMDGYTYIAPLHEKRSVGTECFRDLSRSSIGSRAFARLIDRGLGTGLVEHLRQGRTLLGTFYAASLIADRAGLPSFCLVTDADCNRVWVPDQPKDTRVHFLAPSERVVHRLRAYGVSEEKITRTGFPLPLELLGGRDLPALRANLAARLARLDRRGRFRNAHAAELAAQLPSIPKSDEPPLIVFAIGGSGAQADLAHRILRALAPALGAGRLRLALVAGLRSALADRFIRWAGALGVERGLEVLHEPDWPTYYRRFNALLARADVLWTKPSEMTFYGALGLPLVLAPPVGAHERYNARWARGHGAALDQIDPARSAGWLDECLDEGVLAEAAWAGFRNLPADGVYRIADVVERSFELKRSAISNA